MNRYENTQSARTILVLVSIGIILISLGAVISANWFPLLVADGLLGATILLTFDLTVIVDADAVRVKFGIGIIKKMIRIANIKNCKIVKNRWWYGWGIRWIPHGWLFNVAGFDAVELQMNDGKIYRLGSNEAEKLCNEIKKRLSQKV